MNGLKGCCYVELFPKPWDATRVQKGFKPRQHNSNYNTFQQDNATTFGILLELFTLIIEARATWSYFHKCHSKVSLHFGCHGTVFPGHRVGQRTESGSRLYHGHQICHICHRITAALSLVLRVHRHQTCKTINNIISECLGLSPLIPSLASGFQIVSKQFYSCGWHPSCWTEARHELNLFTRKRFCFSHGKKTHQISAVKPQ